MGKLSELDLKWIHIARRDGILQDIKSEALDFKDGIILMSCSDGDQFHNVYSYLAPIVAKQAGFERIHPLPLNGGALVLAPGSPLNDLQASICSFLNDVLDDSLFGVFLNTLSPVVRPFGHLFRLDFPQLVQIWQAIRLKHIKTIVLSSHAPCGAAGLCCLSFPEILFYQSQAKRRLKRFFRHLNIRVPCLFHVDYGPVDENKKKTRKRLYFTKTHLTDEWLLDNRLISRSIRLRSRVLPF